MGTEMTDKMILEGIDGLAFGDYLMIETAIKSAQELARKADHVLILRALMLAHANGAGCAALGQISDGQHARESAQRKVQSVYREVGDD